MRKVQDFLPETCVEASGAGGGGVGGAGLSERMDCEGMIVSLEGFEEEEEEEETTPELKTLR